MQKLNNHVTIQSQKQKKTHQKQKTNKKKTHRKNPPPPRKNPLQQINVKLVTT